MKRSPVGDVLDLYLLDTRPLWGRRWGTPADFRQRAVPTPSAAMARRAQRCRRAQQRRKPPLILKLSLYSVLPFPQRGKGWG